MLANQASYNRSFSSSSSSLAAILSPASPSLITVALRRTNTLVITVSVVMESAHPRTWFGIEGLAFRVHFVMSVGTSVNLVWCQEIGV